MLAAIVAMLLVELVRLNVPAEPVPSSSSWLALIEALAPSVTPLPVVTLPTLMVTMPLVVLALRVPLRVWMPSPSALALTASSELRLMLPCRAVTAPSTSMPSPAWKSTSPLVEATVTVGLTVMLSVPSAMTSLS